LRAALDIAQEHEASLWIAGMADIHKYQTERTKAALSLVKSGAGQLSFRIICLTDPGLYDQPLTLEIKTMASRPLERVAVKDMDGAAIAVRPWHAGAQTVWRFDVFPRAAEYTIEWKP
jgi:hypothetical protein